MASEQSDNPCPEVNADDAANNEVEGNITDNNLMDVSPDVEKESNMTSNCLHDSTVQTNLTINNLTEHLCKPNFLENGTNQDSLTTSKTEKQVTSNELDCEIKGNNAIANFPLYNFEEVIEVSKATKCFNIKQFLIGCKWSPDGSCLLTNCADYTIRIFDLPSQLYNKKIWNKDKLPDLEASLKITEGGQIYDYDWYPFMSSWTPESCCFLTTSYKSPVHLWDAYTGKIRATYSGYDRVAEIACAFSVKFSLNGEKIYCGYKNEIKMFDVSKPGRDYINIDTKHVAGQSGIISCIADNPTVPNMFAAGSYKKTIGLYIESGDSLCLLKGQRGGITHLKWANDGVCLYSGARKDKEILCWDMRNPGEVLFSMERTVTTNQRIYFDLTPDGKYLISGSTNGEVLVWDLSQSPLSGKIDPAFRFQTHLDCTNGVSAHNHLPLVATSSGQYHFPDLTSDDEDNQFFDVKKMCSRVENNIKIWWTGASKDVTN